VTSPPPASERAVFVYRLIVEIPPECLGRDFVPDELREKETYRDWYESPFRWPRRRLYLHWTSAAYRAAMLRRWGATVRVERSRVESWEHVGVWNPATGAVE
jgi:hypothetical protein